MIAWPAKDPAEELDFTWLVPLDAGDTIATFAAAVSSGTIVKGAEGNTDTSATVWFTGGAADELAMVNLTAATANGRKFRETAVLPVIDRASEVLAQFRLTYPAFDAVDDGRISFWLAKAGALVGESWIEASRIPARVSWAAHKLAESGAISGAVPAGLTSFKSGTFSATVSDSVASLQGLESTIYGRDFLALRRASFAGPRLAWTPLVGCRETPATEQWEATQW